MNALLVWVDERIRRARIVKDSYINQGQFVNAVCARDFEAFLREFRREVAAWFPEPIHWRAQEERDASLKSAARRLDAEWDRTHGQPT